MTQDTPGSEVETPSGKAARDENFPVGSILLPPALRPHVAAYYAFARAGDDIADNPDLAPEDKIARLDAFDAALATGQGDPVALAKPLRLRRCLLAAGVDLRHARDLLVAFRRDATKLRYADWGELMDYCAVSAAPVGRFLVELHGEDPAAFAASDPLCAALQVLNHLQDLKDDHRRLDRVYLPRDWMAAEGVTVHDLHAPAASPGLRRVIDRCLERTDTLIDQAHRLPGRLANRRFAMESAVIVRLAARLAARLRKGDPVAGRVALNRGDFVLCGIGGVIAGLVRRDAGASAAAEPGRA